MGRTLLKTIAITTLLGVAAPVVHADTSFGIGSIILPANGTYQDDCGNVAVYGLVYNVLRANAWLAAKGYGTIEVYYAYKDTKASPNRCTPTNKHAGPAYGASAAGQVPAYPAVGAPLHNDAKWNDGCDFEVVDGSTVNGTPPVRLVNKASPTLASDTDISTRSTTASADIFPRWGSQPITDANLVTTVRYSGGPFIISDADAPNFLKLISGQVFGADGLARDSASGGNVIDFSPFKLGSCTFGTSIGGNVAVHRAYVPFTAPTPKVFTSTPPRLALLASDKNSRTGTIFNNILEKYLRNGGLNFSGAQGCPSGGVYASNATQCPGPNFGSPGQIYDLFDFQDLVDNKIAANVAGVPVYKMFWAPHWDLAGASSNGYENTAVANLTSFLDGQAGLMGECASVQSLEGVPSGFSAPVAAVPGAQYQTCKDNGSGACAAAAFQYGLQKNSAGGGNSSPNGTFQNCTDMNVTASSSCIFFSNPGDPFAQVGDYKWKTNLSGSAPASTVADFKPMAGATLYRPGVLPLISGVNSLVKTGLNSPSAARAMIAGDLATRSYKDNNTAKSSILYIGSHDMTASVVGTKVALQTLLLLGDPTPPPTTLEVTRSSPIIATIGGTPALVQGSFERVTPPPTTLTANTTAELASFRFPDIKGHMRAVNLSTVTTAGVDFSTVPIASVIFDAANGIPSTVGSYTGCGAGAFKGACRTIFTHTAAGALPPRLLFDVSNLLPIATAMSSGSTLVAADFPLLLLRIIAGIETTPGVFAPKLGGVDHSTVAIVPASLVAGSSSRPTIVYFGAADGMLHAVCAQVAPSFGCDILGRELWAFIPRLQLQLLRKNTARVDGSPRVLDMFGDFYGTGVRSFRTILMFQTANGNSTINGQQPSVTALDITDVNDPKILWDIAGPVTGAGTVEMGTGLIVNAGKVNTGASFKSVAFIQTNNGGTGGTGNVVTAVDIETGLELWQTGYVFPNPPRGAGTPVPSSGIPGGAVGLDKQSNGSISEVVFGTLYGDIWQLEAATGLSRHGANPLFRYGSNLHPFGTPPTLYSSTGSFYALMVPGAYVDPSAFALWTQPAQTAVAVSLGTPTGNAPLDEASGSPYVPWTFPLTNGDKSFSQAVVIGGEVFITADSQDVNSTTYGTTPGNTGTVYQVSLANPSSSTTYVVAGGASSIAATTSTVYMGSKTTMQALSGSAPVNTGDAVNSATNSDVTRRLWLRTL